MHAPICIFILVSFKNLNNDAFKTAKHFIYSPVSITAKWKKYPTLCYYSKTIDLGGGGGSMLLCLKDIRLLVEKSKSCFPYHHWSCPRSKSLLYVAQHHSFA